MQRLTILPVSSFQEVYRELEKLAQIIANISTTSVTPPPPVDLSGYIPVTQKGIAGGVASLDSSGKVPVTQLPPGGSPVSSVFGRLGAVVKASGDYDVSDITGAAPLTSPVFIGDPQVPTPAPGDNDNSVASTAFVQSAVSGVLPLWVRNHPDNPPVTPNAMDDECTGAMLDAKWTLVDPSGINASVTKSYNVDGTGWLSYSCPSSVQNRIYALTQPAPAGTWRVRSKMAFDSATWNYFGLYLIARRGSVSKSSMAGPLYHSSYGAITTYATRVNEPSTLVLDQDLYDIRSDVFYLELEYDGTNLIWRIAKTGGKYTRFWSETAATFLGGAPETLGVNFHFYGGSSDVNHIMTGSMKWFRRVA